MLFMCVHALSVRACSSCVCMLRMCVHALHFSLASLSLTQFVYPLYTPPHNTLTHIASYD
jgi:hypothetical protein